MVIYLLTCGSIFLLAFILISNSGGVNVPANRWLGFFFFCTGCALLEFIAVHTELHIGYPYLVPLTELTRFAMAPSIYLSILFFTSARRRLMPKDYLHFIPAVLFLVFSVPLLLRSIGVTFSFTFSLNETFSRYLGLVMSVIIKIQFFIYWLLALRLLLQHQRNVGLFASCTDIINLGWLKYLLWGVGCMMLLWFNQVFDINTRISHFTGIGYFIAIYLIGYFSLKQKEIFPYEDNDKEALQVYLAEGPAAISRERLSDAGISVLKARLEDLMCNEKVFTDSEMSLPQLAQKMDVSIHQLSYLLNKGYGKNFFQYINSYRVELAKELLLSQKHKHLSILGIAFEAGFNSKTTFNTTFKKATGQSPSAYRNEKMVKTGTDG